METYQGVLTQEERADAERLRREFASRILILTFGQSERLLAEPNTFYAGSISEDAVEAHISGIAARLPWEAVTAYAGVQGTVLLLAGQVCLPVARSLFPVTNHGRRRAQSSRRRYCVPRSPDGL
jgi:hypothetical protein